MKDLDFDELDRAVNSLLTTNSNPVSSEPVESSPVSSQTSGPEAVVTKEPVVTAAPLAARRSSGRFMDVVHPSSDMRTAVIPSRPVSREGMGVAPLATSEQSDIGVPAPQNLTESTPQANVVAPSSETPVSTANEWPDPLDFNGFAQTDPVADATEEAPKEEQPPQLDQTNSISNDQDGDINQITDDINKTLGIQGDASAPLESPFLADAKVEKRPLGAFSVEPSATPAETPQAAELVQPVEPSTFTPTVPEEPQTDQKPIELVTPLPAELGEDLLSIESDTDTTGNPKSEMTPIAQTPQPEVSTGPASIPQQ